jgi:hypothetical protein
MNENKLDLPSSLYSCRSESELYARIVVILYSKNMYTYLKVYKQFYTGVGAAMDEQLNTYNMLPLLCHDLKAVLPKGKIA